MNFELIKETIKKQAEKCGIKEYELFYMSDETMSVQTLKDEISSFSSGVSGGLSFRCLVNGKMGYSSTELFEPEEIEGLVLRAVENAECIEKEDTAGIFAGSPSYEKVNSAEFVAESAEDLKKAALNVQRSAYGASEHVTDGTQSFAEMSAVNIRIFNSHGLDLSNRAGVNLVYSLPVVRVGEEAEEDFNYDVLTKDTDTGAIAAKAVDGALGKIGSGNVETGKYNIVFSSKTMRSMLSVFSAAFSAKQAQLGLSLLAGKEGQKIAADIITITDDPMRPGAAMQTPFDFEGVAAHRKSVVENGVLKTLLYNLETAKKAGIESTGNAKRGGYSSPVGISPYAFCIENGELTKEELLKLTKDGLYITEVKGLHAGADPVTGDFSIESAGALIEDGKITKPVKSFTVAGNFFELLKDIAAIANNLELMPGGFTSFGSPDVMVRDMSVAGK